MGSDSVVQKFILDLDDEEFVKKLQNSLGLFKEIGDPENLKGLLGVLGEVGAVLGVVTAAGLAVKTAIDLTEEAEKVNQINKSFELLAESVNLSATALKDGLVVAAHGLVDDTDLLEAANKAIIAMGDNAARIPEILDLARKATVIFGGNMIDNFENMNRALAAGNTRMLRQYGIIIDATKAQDAYAKTLGVSRDLLDDTGRRQAIMNAALDQGKEKFKDINENTGTATISFQKMGVSLKEIGEVALHVWDVVFGPAVRLAASALSNIFEGMALRAKAWFGSADVAGRAHIEMLENQKKKLEETVAWNEAHPGLGAAASIRSAKEGLEKVNKELDTLKEKQKALEDSKPKKPGETGDKVVGIDYEKKTKEHEKFEKDLLKMTEDRIKAEEKTITTEEQAEEQGRQDQIRIRRSEAQQISEIKKEQLDKGIINEKEFEQAVGEIHRKANAQIEASDRQSDQRKIQALKNLEEANKNTAAGISAAMARNSAEAGQNFRNMAKLGQTTFNAVGSNATAAFKGLGDGSKDAAGAMRGFFFGAIGDIAEQQGEMMLLMGLWPPNPVAIAAGGALVALGSMLKSMGQGSQGSASSGGGGGGSYGGASSTQMADQAPVPEAAKEKKTVTVAIHGNYFETDQTRTRLMDMIRESGDFTDFNLLQIGQP